MSKTADEYNAERHDLDGTVAPLVSWLTKYFQLDQAELLSDGKLGPATEAALREVFGASLSPRISPAPPKYATYWPMTALPGGRLPVVTSGHHLVNPERGPKGSYPGHQGCDIMYVRQGLEFDFMGDRGNGDYWVPLNARAIAVADGKVEAAYERESGWCIKLMHPDGYMTAYRHLENVYVSAGNHVVAGSTIGTVGAGNTGLVHLHFELFAPDKYDYYADESLNPVPWLANAMYKPWKEHWNY